MNDYTNEIKLHLFHKLKKIYKFHYYFYLQLTVFITLNYK